MLLILCSATLLLIAILSVTICFIRLREKKNNQRKDGLNEVEAECKINPSQVFLVDVSNDIYNHHINNDSNLMKSKNDMVDVDYKDDDYLANGSINEKNVSNNVYVIGTNHHKNTETFIENQNEKHLGGNFETSLYNTKRHSHNYANIKPKFANFSLQLKVIR